MNASEVVVAQAVMVRLSDVQARELAEHLLTEHAVVEARLSELLGRRGRLAEPTPLSQALDGETQRLLTELAGLSERELDRTYVQRQVSMHQQALALIDCVVAPSFQDADLRALLLDATRPAMTQHLADASELAASLDEGESQSFDRGDDARPAECGMVCLPSGGGGSFSDPIRATACTP